MEIIETRIGTDDPGPRPERGQFSGQAFARHRREKPDFAPRREVLLVLIVISPLSVDGEREILPGELLRDIDALAKVAQIFVMRLLAHNAVGLGMTKDQVQRLRSVVAEEQLERSESGCLGDSRP